MEDDKRSTASQLRDDIAPAASPLGTDDEAAGTTPSSDRVEMARRAEDKIDAARRPDTEAADDAHSQRGSSAPYAKEDHMNEELAKRHEDAKLEEDPSEQPS